MYDKFVVDKNLLSLCDIWTDLSKLPVAVNVFYEEYRKGKNEQEDTNQVQILEVLNIDSLDFRFIVVHLL